MLNETLLCVCDSPINVVVDLVGRGASAWIYIKGALSWKHQSSVYSSYTITNLEKS